MPFTPEEKRAYRRTPRGWSEDVANKGTHTGRAKRAGLPSPVTGPEIRAKAEATFGYCAVTNRKSGLPWLHVGDKAMGLEMDHIFTITECKVTGRVWNHIDNIQFISKAYHKRKTAAETRRLARKWLEESNSGVEEES